MANRIELLRELYEAVREWMRIENTPGWHDDPDVLDALERMRTSANNIHATGIFTPADEATQRERLAEALAEPAPHVEPCTGITASWCPNCGDCICPEDEPMNHEACPLHGRASKHGECQEATEAAAPLNAWTGDDLGAAIRFVAKPKTSSSPQSCSSNCDCCDRAGEYNGYGSDGPRRFSCPKGCTCHD